MMRTVYFFVSLFFALLGKIPFAMRMKRLRGKIPIERYREAVRVPVTRLMAGVLKWAGVKAEVTGVEHIPGEGAVLFVGNHQSDFDIALMLAHCPRQIGFVSKMSVSNIPIVKSAMLSMGCVFMDRDDPRQSVKAILEGIELLKGGGCLVIYPEGTRSGDGSLLEFKPGSFKLATKSSAVVVPVTVSGTRFIMEANGGRIKPASVSLTFHPPIRTAGMSREEEAALPGRARGIIESALAR